MILSHRTMAGLIVALIALIALVAGAPARADQQTRPTRPPSAIEVVAYRTALMKHPDAVKAVERGVDSMLDEDCAAALVQFDKALAIDPKNFEAYIERSQCDIGQGDLTRALADAQRGVKAAPWLDQAYEARAMVLAARGELEAGWQDCETAARIPADPDRNLLDCRGYVEFALGRYAEAAVHLQFTEHAGDDRHRALFLYFTSRRLGREGEIELAKHGGPDSLQGVLSDVVAMILGRLSEDSVLQRAVSDADRCAVAFYVGEWDLLKGQTDLAADRLQRAAGCNAGYKTTLGARAEMKRLIAGR
jgi:tetratricopeptide (TPR) repeat protein